MSGNSKEENPEPKRPRGRPFKPGQTGNLTNRRGRGVPFKPGQSGNPTGRPKLPEEIKKAKAEVLSVAVAILREKIADKEYIESLRAADLLNLLTLAFDRCGLPRLSQNELTGLDGSPLVPPEARIDFSKFAPEMLRKLIEATD